MRVCHRTHQGLVRASNQDSLLAEGRLYGVADGMGGHKGGETASRVAVQVVKNALSRKKPEEDALRMGLEAANRRVYGMAGSDENLTGMGTTMTLLWEGERRILIGHVGDTRVYRISDQHIRVVTEDQTVVVREVQQGRLTPEEAEADPRRSVLLQCIGASRIVEPVYYSGRVVPDECWLLCSDGFRHEISAQEIQEALRPESNRSEADMEHHLRTLVETDKDRMEQDNISAILIRTVKGELGHGGYWADH